MWVIVKNYVPEIKGEEPSKDFEAAESSVSVSSPPNSSASTSVVFVFLPLPSEISDCNHCPCCRKGCLMVIRSHRSYLPHI